jgi:hypothetical protein
MMNEHGKSDRFVVPRKPPNNARARAAEAGDGRERTEGTRPSVPRCGLRAGTACPARSSVYGRQRLGTGNNGSRTPAPRARQLSACVQPTSRSRERLRRESMARRGGTTARPWRRTFGISPSACSEERIVRSRPCTSALPLPALRTFSVSSSRTSDPADCLFRRDWESGCVRSAVIGSLGCLAAMASSKSFALGLLPFTK